MKKNKLIIPALALVIFIPLVTMAASNDSTSLIKNAFGRGEGRLDMVGERLGEHRNLENLTEDEKATFQANMEAKRAEMDNMTVEEREAFRQERIAERDAIQKAIEAGDYDAWLALASEKNCPFLNEVTRENFVDFFQNHKIGPKDGMGKGMGKGMGMRKNLNSQAVTE